MALGLQLRGDIHHRINGDRKRDTHEPARLTENLRIDADHFTIQIEQGPARIAGIDRGIGLNEGGIGLVRQGTIDGGHNAGCHSVVETERRADGQHPLAHLEIGGLAEFHHRQFVGLNLEHGHIGTGIRTDQAGLELALVGQRHRNLVSACHHMGIGQHIAVRRDNETRPQ